MALGPRAYPCVPNAPDIRSIMASSGTRAGSTLNTYVTDHAQHMTGIKYVQDITRSIGYTQSRYSTMRPVEPDYTAHGHDVAGRRDITFIRSSTSSLTIPN
jgi:hypothetical protein